MPQGPAECSGRGPAEDRPPADGYELDTMKAAVILADGTRPHVSIVTDTRDRTVVRVDISDATGRPDRNGSSAASGDPKTKP